MAARMLLLESAVTWQFRRHWSVTLSAKVPVARRTVGEQLNTPALGELTSARAFDL